MIAVISFIMGMLIGYMIRLIPEFDEFIRNKLKGSD